MFRPLDDLDLSIIATLQEDGRTPTVEIARRAGAAEATVRRRLAELVDSGVVRVTAVVDPMRLGFSAIVVLLISVEMRQYQAVAQAIANLREIRYAKLLTGTYHIIAEAWFTSNQSLAHFLTDTLPSIPGITNCETVHVLALIKRSHECDQEALIGSEQSIAA
jgi:Lrp/AsnC family transcriptional regulator, regulator for asnA, asnC and gidA